MADSLGITRRLLLRGAPFAAAMITMPISAFAIAMPATQENSNLCDWQGDGLYEVKMGPVAEIYNVFHVSKFDHAVEGRCFRFEPVAAKPRGGCYRFEVHLHSVLVRKVNADNNLSVISEHATLIGGAA